MTPPGETLQAPHSIEKTDNLAVVQEVSDRARESLDQVFRDLSGLETVFKLAKQLFETRQHEAERFLRYEARETFESLPTPNAWPVEITDI